MSTSIIFGGSGFVGRHLVRYLLNENAHSRIFIADLVPPEWDTEQITYVNLDIRESIAPISFDSLLSDACIVIYNLAAISKIPGSPNEDYYRTNILGAENICAFADLINCKTMVFTSTMAVYGASEDEKREDTLLQPDNPYGISKMAAEYIHTLWQAKGTDRRMSIVRPGVIFGEGEKANFERLYHGINRGYFFYPGRKDTKKACIYVKDVAQLLHRLSMTKETFNLYNFVHPHPHTIEGKNWRMMDTS
jgi:nucleoside-diphosphate-sugar epimerase